TTKIKHLELADYRTGRNADKNYTFAECGSRLKDLTQATTNVAEVTCKVCRKRA
ncbi:hypothetical protein LCGC14_2356570, partial [marine sediment metagenome]